MVVLDSRQWSPPLLDQTILLHHSFCGRRRSDHRDRCDECCKGRIKFHASASLKESDAFGNVVASLGRHRLGIEPDEHPGAKGRAPRRTWDSQLPDLSRAAFDPGPSLRNLWQLSRISPRSGVGFRRNPRQSAANTAKVWKNANLLTELRIEN